MILSAAFPTVIEFGPGSTTCASYGLTGTGCAVCSTAAVLVRWGKPIPRLSNGTPNMIALGRSMGARHRTDDSRVRHGLSLVSGAGCSGGYWCAYCAFLELRARGVPVAYEQLSMSQIWAQLDAKHAVVLPGDGWQVPYVSPGTYDARTPARGRGQRSFSTRPFPHMVTAWESIRSAGGARTGAIVSDPNFGSGGKVAPPYSIYTDEVLERFWGALGWGVCHTLTAPPPLAEPEPDPAPVPSGEEVVVLYVMASGYDASSLPVLEVPAGTAIEDLAGKPWATLKSATSVRVGGLANGSTKRRLVLVNTARYYPDGEKRPTWQVAVVR